ncbi:hypothetical protein [Methylobacterium sp. XJLW]|uniref:hypothetical protein n=1 Tax=Methylobacterium sp. XJLW TaxID=739141 RepID=UPI000F550BB9|nr:hypothetical protein [Methylobacterium sp. XJLW]
MSGRPLVGEYIANNIGPDALAVYRQNIEDAIRGDCESRLHNHLANVSAGVSDWSLGDDGHLRDEWVVNHLDSMHLTRVDSYYSDKWYWNTALELAFENRSGIDYAEKARRLYVKATGMSDRVAYTEEAKEFCGNLFKAAYSHHFEKFGLIFSATRASIRLYEKAGIEPHVAVIPAKRGGRPSTYVSDRMREAFATWNPPHR